jgi:hypothetical protein
MSDTSTTAGKKKRFGGCGCGSPFCFELLDGSLELSYPSHPDLGNIILPAAAKLDGDRGEKSALDRLQGLRNMINGVLKREGRA